jgi:hypothetical protein
VPPEGVWTTCRHMQSPRELQQLHNWSANAEIRISWQDGEDGRLACFVQEIAGEVVATAEINHREYCVRGFGACSGRPS